MLSIRRVPWADEKIKKINVAGSASPIVVFWGRSARRQPPVRPRTIDAGLIDGAALALDLRAKPAAVDRWPPQAVNAADREIPAALEPASTAVAPRGRRTAVLTAAVAVAVATIWFGARGSSRSVDHQSEPARQSPASILAPPVVRPTPAPPSEPTTVPAPPGPARATTSEPSSAASIAAAGEATAARFDIIVASFRTEARAASVAAQVSDLGLPVRQRAAGGWQQVLAGPFASRDEAEKVHQRLERAGLADTHVVSAGR